MCSAALLGGGAFLHAPPFFYTFFSLKTVRESERERERSDSPFRLPQQPWGKGWSQKSETPSGIPVWASALSLSTFPGVFAGSWTEPELICTIVHATMWDGHLTYQDTASLVRVPGVQSWPKPVLTIESTRRMSQWLGAFCLSKQKQP